MMKADSFVIFAQILFNLSKRVFLGIEIKILEKSLDYALIQRKFNKLELNSDSEEFFRCIRIKC